MICCQKVYKTCLHSSFSKILLYIIIYIIYNSIKSIFFHQYVSLYLHSAGLTQTITKLILTLHKRIISFSWLYHFPQSPHSLSLSWFPLQTPSPASPSISCLPLLLLLLITPLSPISRLSLPPPSCSPFNRCPVFSPFLFLLLIPLYPAYLSISCIPLPPLLHTLLPVSCSAHSLPLNHPFNPSSQNPTPPHFSNFYYLRTNAQVMADKLEIVSCIYCHHCLVREDTLINNNTDRILDVVFSRFRVFSFTITLRQTPKGVTCMPCWITIQRKSLFYAACAYLFQKCRLRSIGHFMT